MSRSSWYWPACHTGTQEMKKAGETREGGKKEGEEEGKK